MLRSSAMRSHAAASEPENKAELDAIMEDADSPLPQTRTLPDALVVTVEWTASMSRLAGSDAKPVDAKIEVFYNGHFSCAKLCNSRPFESVHMFSGERLNANIERPWLLNRQNTKHYHDESQRRRDCEARWALVNQALHAEALDRGVDQRNRPLPIADYLSSLSETTLPRAIMDDTTHGLEPHMGIIDVVICIGHGTKQTDERHDLRHPERLHDPQKSMQLAQNKAKQTPVDEPHNDVHASSKVPRLTNTMTASESHAGKSLAPIEGLLSSQPSRLDSVMTDAPNAVTARTTRAELATNLGVKHDGPLVSLLEQSDKNTSNPASVSASIWLPNTLDTLPRKPSTPATFGRRHKQTPLVPHPSLPFKPAVIVPSTGPPKPTIKLKFPALTASITEASLPEEKRIDEKHEVVTQSPESTNPSQTPTISNPLSLVSRTTTSARTKDKLKSTLKETRERVVPPLSQDCIATYATTEILGDQDEQSDDLVAGLYRHVRTERNGEFAEESVLFGVRFVVG